MVFKLSKLLNQEDALSVPACTVDSALRRPARVTQESCGKTFVRCFLGQSTVCDHRVILLRGGDAFRVVGGRCMGRGRRCNARQGLRKHNGADRLITYSHISMVFGSCREGLDNFFVTRQPVLFKRVPVARLHHPARREVTKVDQKARRKRCIRNRSKKDGRQYSV